MNFVEIFPNESSCKAKFKEYRNSQGVICPTCGSMDHYWNRDKESYECKHCGRRSHTWFSITISLLVYLDSFVDQYPKEFFCIRDQC